MLTSSKKQHQSLKHDMWHVVGEEHSLKISGPLYSPFDSEGVLL